MLRARHTHGGITTRTKDTVKSSERKADGQAGKEKRRLPNLVSRSAKITNHDRSNEADTHRRDRDTWERRNQYRNRPVLEHLRGGHSGSGDGDDGNSVSTAFWRFRDSGSFQGERA
jgi:hypothetical protein